MITIHVAVVTRRLQCPAAETLRSAGYLVTKDTPESFAPHLNQGARALIVDLPHFEAQRLLAGLRDWWPRTIVITAPGAVGLPRIDNAETVPSYRIRDELVTRTDLRIARQPLPAPLIRTSAA